MSRIDVIKNAIHIIECCANTNEPEVDETLKGLIEIKPKLEFDKKRRWKNYVNKSNSYSSN